MRFPLPILLVVFALAACGGGGGGGSSSQPPQPVERDWSLQMTTANASGDLHADEALHYRFLPQFTPTGVLGEPAPTITIEVRNGGVLKASYSITDAACGMHSDLDIPAADWDAAWGANAVSVTARLATQPGFIDPNTINNLAWIAKSYAPSADGTYTAVRTGGLDPHGVVIDASDHLALTGSYQGRSLDGTAVVVAGAFSYSIPITTLGGIVQYQATITGTVTVERAMIYAVVLQERYLISGVGWGSWSTYTSTWTGNASVSG